MDKHGEDCNCEEGLDHDQVTLTLEDGSEVVCDIIAVFPCGEKEYIALLPENSGEEGEVYLYQFIQNDDDEIELVNIEDDEEFDAVSDAFDEFLDSEEFEEMLNDEDDEEEEEEEEE